MTDEQKWLELHVAIMEQVANLARRGIELSEEGKIKEAKAIHAKAREWEDLAKRLEKLTKKPPPF